MEIELSSLWREVQQIINATSKPVHFLWKAQVIPNSQTPDKVVNALSVLSVDIISNYEDCFGDEVTITLAIPPGDYAANIYPYQDDLDIILYKYPLMEASDVVDTSQPTQSERFTAILYDRGNPIIEANANFTPTKEILNLTNIHDFTFQLTNKAIEKMRLIETGGNYRSTSVENVIKGVLTNVSLNLKIEKARSPQGVDMVKADNQEKWEHIVIPQGTSLTHLPAWVHAKCRGVYSSGLGYYYTNDWWYVYPCYDVTRFNKTTRTITVVNIPSNKLPSIERTYRKDGDNLVILATGQVIYRNDTNKQQLNAGNGARFAIAENLLTNFATTKNNKTTVSRAKNNNEFISIPRPNGLNNTKVSESVITSNVLGEISKLSKRQGNYISLNWENSNPSLLMPGMMAHILYMDGDMVGEIYGVVLKTHTFVKTKAPGLSNTRHICNTAISIFVKPPYTEDA